MGSRLWVLDHHFDGLRKGCSLASAKQGQPIDAQNVRAWAKNAGAKREVQRRSDPDESGVDETVQGARRKPRRRLSPDDDSDPDLFWPLQHAWTSRRAAERNLP